MTTDERNALVLSAWPMIAHVAYTMATRYGPRGIDRAEFEGIGALAAFEATERFDAARGVPFKRYAERRVRGAMLDHLREIDPLTRTERLNVRQSGEPPPIRVVSIDAWSRRRLDEEARGRVDSEGDEIERRLSAESVFRAAHLPERQALVLELAYGPDEVPLAEIGRALGVTEARAWQLREEAIARLRATADRLTRRAA